MISKLFKRQEVRYGISSVLSFIIDNVLYYFFLWLFGLNGKAYSQIVARALSSFFNFNLNKYYAYQKKREYQKDLIRYYCLCIPQTIVSVILTGLVQSAAGVSNPMAATVVKVLIDAFLFVVSFFIQKIWVFKK